MQFLCGYFWYKLAGWLGRQASCRLGVSQSGTGCSPLLLTTNTHRYINNNCDKLNSFSQIHFYFSKLQIDNCFSLVYCRSSFFWFLLLKIQPWIKYLIPTVISPFFLSVCECCSLVPTLQQPFHIVGSIEGGDVVWFGGFHSLFWGFICIS